MGSRTVQKMHNASGVQLGLLSILRERGKHCQKNPDGQYTIHELNKLCNSCRHHTEKEDPTATCCLYGVLSKEPDFLEQKSWLSETVEKYPGCYIFFYPKFHCELNFIEMIWGWTKGYHRRNCTYNYKDLKEGLPITFEEIMPIAYVRRAFDHCLRFMAGYRVGLTGAVLEYAVKKYKSHRRLSSSINLESIENEYVTKKRTQMTFKRCKIVKI